MSSSIDEGGSSMVTDAASPSQPRQPRVFQVHDPMLESTGIESVPVHVSVFKYQSGGSLGVNLEVHGNESFQGTPIEQLVPPLHGT